MGSSQDLCSGPAERASLVASPERVRALVDTQFEFVWRSLRRLGLSSADADDATQEVFLVAIRRLGDIEPESERSFLYGTCLRVASMHRRSARRMMRRIDDVASAPIEAPPDPEELTQRQRERRELDAVLDELDDELRAVFVLFELEELSLPEIAVLLELKPGTAASRLRRAREQFRAAVKRLEARQSFGGMR